MKFPTEDHKGRKELNEGVIESGLLVIPAQAGIQIATLDSRLRGNDGTLKPDVDDAEERCR